MQIHELPNQSTTTDTDQYPLDTGSTTRKISFANLKNQILQKANPSFTSGDNTAPTAWANVAALASGEVMTSVLNKISLMFRNIRYLYANKNKFDTTITVNGSVYLPTNITKGTAPDTDSGYQSLAWLEKDYASTDNSGRLGAIRQYTSADGTNVVQMMAHTPTHGATSAQQFSLRVTNSSSYAYCSTNLGIGKNYGGDGNPGVWANTSGNVYLTGAADAGPYIYFYYGGATTSTSYIREASANHIDTSAYLRARIYNGTIAQVVGSVATDGNQIAYFSSNENALFVNGQHGTTGTTFSNKNIAFSTSDIRLKDNIKDSEVEALPVINNMRVREFDWKDGRADKHQKIGMVADELEALDPKLAVGGGYDINGNINEKSVDTYYLVGYLVKAVQELSAEVEQLKRGR